MSVLLFAAVVGVLFATGTYMLLRRRPINLILGLGLLTYGVNLLLFSNGRLKRGAPPILDKATFTGDLNEISLLVDPLPQALILTAIVISFGVTAFAVVLINRRNMLMQDASAGGIGGRTQDPFSIARDHLNYNVDDDDPEAAPDDYEWLEYDLVDEYLQNIERQKRPKAEDRKKQNKQTGPKKKRRGKR